MLEDERIRIRWDKCIEITLLLHPNHHQILARSKHNTRLLLNPISNFPILPIPLSLQNLINNTSILNYFPQLFSSINVCRHLHINNNIIINKYTKYIVGPHDFLFLIFIGDFYNDLSFTSKTIIFFKSKVQTQPQKLIALFGT